MSRKAILSFSLFAAAASMILGMSRTAYGQIFVTNGGSGPQPQGTMGKYDLDGTTVNASLVTGLYYPSGIVVSGSELFVTGGGNNGYVGKYTTSGATVNPLLISGGGDGIAISGSSLFLTSSYGGTVGEYNTSGATINASLISGLSPGNGPYTIAVSGSNLFIDLRYENLVAEYTTSGALVNASLISGLNNLGGVVVSGSDLYILNDHAISKYTTSGILVNPSLITGVDGPFAVFGSNIFVTGGGANGYVAEYTTSGALVNPSLITGLSFPSAIAVVPEPAAVLSLALGGMAILHLRPTRGRTTLRMKK